jgi:hypothetical protein
MIERIYNVVREAAENGHALGFNNEKQARLVCLAARNLGLKTEKRIVNKKIIIEVKNHENS